MSVYARFYELLPLLSFIVNIFLISLVLRSDWRSTRYRIFALFLLTMGLWGFTIFGMRSTPHTPHPDAALAFRWESAVIAIIPGVSVLYYHFTVLYTRARTYQWLLPAFYGAWLAFALMAPTTLIVSHMEEVPLWGRYLGWSARFTSVLGTIYLLVSLAPTILAIQLLARVSRATRSPEERTRYMYILLGGASSLVGALTDFLFAKGILFYPFGIVGNLLFAAFTTVAILRFRLLELRVLLRQGFIYTLLGIVIAGIYGAVFTIFALLFRSQGQFAQTLAAVGGATIVAIALQPFLGRLQRWADRVFDRQRYDHLQALEDFSRETKDITDLVSISNSLTALVRRAMQANSATLMLPAAQDGQDGRFYMASSSGGLPNVEAVTLRGDSPLFGWLRRNDGILTRDDLEVNIQFRAMSGEDQAGVVALDAELFIPLKSKGQLTGMLVVGPKLSEEDYSAADTELLLAVVNQTATTIENARLYAQEAQRLAELEQLEKLKQTLLMTVSHELKTPLTAIKAGTEMLQMQEAAPETSAKGRLLRSIGRGVERLERLIDESLDYARMQDANLQLEMQPSELKEIIEETAGIVMPAIRAKRQSIDLKLPERIPTVYIDRRRCERVLLNLISNANRYTPPGGNIKVTMDIEPTYVVTTVLDNGQGIPDSEVDKIFNAYYRNGQADGKGAGQSSGLGLAIAKYLVELHGGRIWVDSKVGEGSAFHFSLPLGDGHENSGD